MQEIVKKDVFVHCKMIYKFSVGVLSAIVLHLFLFEFPWIQFLGRTAKFSGGGEGGGGGAPIPKRRQVGNLLFCQNFLITTWNIESWTGSMVRIQSFTM